MKKFARYALAFAVVTSVSGSAMALRNDCAYKAETSSGLRMVNIGSWVAAYEEQLMPNMYESYCSHRINWFNGPNGAPVSVAKLRVMESTTFEDQDCYSATWYYTNSIVSADPATRNQAFDQRYQIVPLYSLHFNTDPWNGVGVGMYKTTPVGAPKQLRLTPDSCPATAP
ncbi:hypothetical protein [Sorangium sp. So ce1024]|jgi:hypothetical protein|uniref:hypothetical protein n=1 Tax=unclassified Sorangium TaxID=2621164 RepID=UPI003F04FAD0